MKQFFSLLLALLLVTSAYGQQIAVVNGAGSTTLYSTLDAAIDGANDGCTIYLPGGGFRITDGKKIEHRVTIMGISHKVDSENADGSTNISGNLNFAPGSDGSAVMGVYLHGDVNIGADGSVEDILVKYCNINSFQVSTNCPGIIVNQNYIRNHCGFGGSNAHLTNNLIHSVEGINGGMVAYNTFFGSWKVSYWETLAMNGDNITSRNNLFSNTVWGAADTGSEYYYDLGDAHFVKWVDCSPKSDVHFSEDWTKNTNIGVHGGGTGFSDGCLPPMPHIVSKTIAEQTDAQGKLKIQVTVKAQ